MLFGAGNRHVSKKSKCVVLMHTWHMLFIHWVVDSLYLATPKSRPVVLVHS